MFDAQYFFGMGSIVPSYRTFLYHDTVPLKHGAWQSGNALADHADLGRWTHGQTSHPQTV